MKFYAKDILKSPAACLQAFREQRTSEQDWWVSVLDIEGELINVVYVHDLYNVEAFTDNVKEALDYMRVQGRTFCWLHWRRDKRVCCGKRS